MSAAGEPATCAASGAGKPAACAAGEPAACALQASQPRALRVLQASQSSALQAVQTSRVLRLRRKWRNISSFAPPRAPRAPPRRPYPPPRWEESVRRERAVSVSATESERGKTMVVQRAGRVNERRSHRGKGQQPRLLKPE